MTPAPTAVARAGKLSALCVFALTATFACSTPAPAPPAAAPPATTAASAPTASAPTASAPTASAPTASDPTDSASPTSAPASSSTSPRPSAVSSVTECASTDLKTGIADVPGGAGMGSVFVLVTFTNTSASPCTLFGWPGVSLVRTRNGAPLGAAATRVQPDDRRVITLDPRRRTTALLKVSQARGYPAARCGPVTAAGYRVYAPGQRQSAFVARRTTACSKKTAELLAVAPVGTRS